MNAPIIQDDLLEQLAFHLQGQPIPPDGELREAAMEAERHALGERFLVVDAVSRLWQTSLQLLAARGIPVDDVLMAMAERLGSLPIPEKRRHDRAEHVAELMLRFHNGLEVLGITRDVSLDGVFFETAYEPKWHLVGEQGVFDFPVAGRPHSFAFRVVRVTDHGVGLQLPRDLGLFGFALSWKYDEASRGI